MKSSNGSHLDRSRSTPVAASSTSLVSGLECRVGRAPLAIPVGFIAQIIEYQSAPLPLAQRWLSGMGLHDGRVVLTIGLLPERAAPANGMRATKAILLHLPEARSEVRWALEIHDVLSFVRATTIERNRPATDLRELPPWIARATIEDGRSIGWIDVPAMLANLTDTAKGRGA